MRNCTLLEKALACSTQKKNTVEINDEVIEVVNAWLHSRITNKQLGIALDLPPTSALVAAARVWRYYITNDKSKEYLMKHYEEER